MKQEDAIFEAQSRWGESAAIRISKRRPAKYDIGYFEEAGGQSLFHYMGSGSTLEKAFAQASKLTAVAITE